MTDEAPLCDWCGHPMELSGARVAYYACGWCGLDYPPARPQVLHLSKLFSTAR